MEDSVNAMTDAEILADADRQEFTAARGRAVRYVWPGFGCNALLDDYCDEAKAERFAVWARRENLRRKGIAHAG
jgi:hypothetical protein